MTNQSPEFDLFAKAADYIKSDIVKKRKEWDESPFSWVLSLPAGTKGKLGMQLIRQWCTLKGLSIGKSPDSEADLLINNRRIEVKFSTLWTNGEYRFQQIRDQNYEHIICLGISPFEVHCWVIDKTTLNKKVIGLMGQHTGKDGKETAWLKINPSAPAEWLKPFGGELAQAYNILKKL